MKWWLVAFMVISVCLLSALPACGGGGDDKNSTSTPLLTSPPEITATPTVITTVTSTPTTSEPVKIGVISPWSGPMALSGGLADQIIALIQDQLKGEGGILGGREVEFVKGDDRGVVAEAVGQVKRLALEEKVDILCFGGVSGASFNAVAQAAEELKIPYISPATIFGGANMKYNISVYTNAVMIDRIANFTMEFIKPRTIAWLSYDDESAHNFLDGADGVVGARERWREKGIDIVYEQYFPLDATDYSAYITAIKYKNPDLVIISVNNAVQAITINKQIMELGGWGNIKVFHCNSSSSAQKAISLPAALGNYVSVEWMAGSDEPGMKAFEDAFKRKYNRLPTPDLAYYYNDFWTGIKAIELASTTNRDKVALAMRSGNLEWDSAWGLLHIPPNGRGAPSLMVAQVQGGGKLVKVWSQKNE